MKLILAPMAAISHAGLRRLIAHFGEPDEYFSEMIHAPSAISGGGFERWYFKTAPSPERLVWQITSPAACAAAKAVPMLLRYGGIGIDLNMGCSAPHIVSTGAGFAWMKKPLTETAHFVRLVKKAVSAKPCTFSAAKAALVNGEKESGTADCYESSDSNGKKKALSTLPANNTQKNRPLTAGKPVRLSVKLRLGEKEDFPFLLKFCTMLVNEGVDLITLHPRTCRQKYSRPCKHEYTARLAAKLSVPVYGNGDITSADSLETLTGKYGCTGWMIGRAAVQKPWIFRTFGKPADRTADTVDLLKTASLFLRFLKEEQPPEFYLTRAKRFFNFYCDNVTFAHHLKSGILNSLNLDSMLLKLEHYFDEVPDDRYVLIN